MELQRKQHPLNDDNKAHNLKGVLSANGGHPVVHQGKGGRLLQASQNLLTSLLLQDPVATLARAKIETSELNDYRQERKYGKDRHCLLKGNEKK